MVFFFRIIRGFLILWLCDLGSNIRLISGLFTPTGPSESGPRPKEDISLERKKEELDFPENTKYPEKEVRENTRYSEQILRTEYYKEKDFSMKFSLILHVKN